MFIWSQWLCFQGASEYELMCFESRWDILLGLKSKLLKLLGLDFHVFYTLAYRFWNIVAGGLSVLLLPWFLDPVEQGYFFTFGSILALQVFFELGLNQIVVQLVSHEVVNLIRQPSGDWLGPDEAKHRLVGLLAFLKKWFAIAKNLF